MILQVMGSFAQFERSLIKERQREGQQAARAKGKLSGRKKSLSPEQITALKARFSAHEPKAQNQGKSIVLRSVLSFRAIIPGVRSTFRY
ncbi:recombinase family protein [Acetobacter thailandicus]|uniref:Recombinase family protein n=1 Tax=Acetobacter thailandicus TaxID=1502842 RepID=A0ABT3QHL8_9PROT|nr:recombinase family protein [Acetobacter thailandicus]MCX2564780.1 recombinase family protein [Acetobacter thailandicus]